YRENNQGLIENTFTLKILNKTEQAHEYTMSVEGLNNYKWYGPNTVTIMAGEVLTLPISVGVDPVELSRSVTDIEIKVKTVIDGKDIEVEQESRFFGP
ncbi:MAG: FixG Ig-like domain-containing protein, partial [Plesiomonas sp.]